MKRKKPIESRYVIGTQRLVLMDAETNEDKGTPNQIVGWRDVAETCRTMYAVFEHTPVNDSPFIVDGIARAGFWGALFREKWPGCSLHLNEKQENCKRTLKRNFPNDTITHFDIREWAPEECDIALLDFDHFTLNILDEWKDVLESWDNTCYNFIIADGACFGFKFGNMKHYGITDAEQYYYLLDESLKKFLNKRITVVSKFENAATILLEDRKVKKIKFVPPHRDIYLSKGGQDRGIFY